MSTAAAPHPPAPHRDRAAECGEPSYVWRSGQARRLGMIETAVPNLASARLLEVGCGVGRYVEKLAGRTRTTIGLEYEPDRARMARERAGDRIVNAAAENLPFADGTFDVVLSNEVIEHVTDDVGSAHEMVRVLAKGGRIVLFCPNRWYPVEQHGVYWRGNYHFGNIPLVNYLPDPLRNRLAPHVRTYTARSLRRLFRQLPVREVSHARIFGGYDNIAARLGRPGMKLRDALHRAEGTPFDVLGLSHLLVLERI